jgi:hypothetical protein
MKQAIREMMYKPHELARNETPNLEDLYLYYFDEEPAS